MVLELVRQCLRRVVQHVLPVSDSLAGRGRRRRRLCAVRSASDSHHIPYQEIRSITLIALLRLGLAPSLRKRAYEQFVKLPLYEDMAPWNIVQQGGRDWQYICTIARGRFGERSAGDRPLSRGLRALH